MLMISMEQSSKHFQIISSVFFCNDSLPLAVIWFLLELFELSALVFGVGFHCCLEDLGEFFPCLLAETLNNLPTLEHKIFREALDGDFV